MLSCEKISYRYGRSGHWVLDQFSHEFSPGIHLIKGYSGCGKSTLLRILGKYINPKKGHIQLRGSNLKRSYRNKQMGFVFQQLNLLPLASVRRNLNLAAALAGVRRKTANERIKSTSGLDDMNTTVIKQVLKEFTDMGERCIIICTHDNRLDEISDEILDFNAFLPIERHLVTLV